MTIVDENHAPGRKRMVRANGRVNAYWVASPAAVKAGYRPKTVPLNDDRGDVVATPEIAARCRALWAKMLKFMAGVERGPSGASIGTIAWVVDLYQTDQDSPYRRIRPATRPGYDGALAIVRSTVGERRIDAVMANDVRRWFKNWGRAGEDGELANSRRAYWCLQMLRIAVKYGKGLLTDTEHGASPGDVGRTGGGDRLPGARARPAEPRPGRRDSVRLRPAPEGRHWRMAEGRRRRAMDERLALGRACQGGLAAREADVQKHFSEVAEFDLPLLPTVMEELQRTPATRRIGPVMLDERTGKPYRQREFARRFREVARAAGVSDTIWNMDARAGAVTDAYDKGAREVDAMDLGTHTQLATNRRYSRNRLAATSRVAVLRFGGKNEPGKGGA
jgi:hypothetical protein